MGSKRHWIWAPALALGLVASSCYRSNCSDPKPIPDHKIPVTAQDSGLSRADRNVFYTASEGSELFPLSWFLLMEDAETGKPFIEDLARFGLIWDRDTSKTLNPYNLPIGITAKQPPDLPFKDAMTGRSIAFLIRCSFSK